MSDQQSIDTQTGAAAPAEVSTQRVHTIFSAIAKKYGRFNAVSSFGAYKLWLNKMARLADIDQTDRLLDIAGGTGDVAFCMAKAKHPAFIMCTDLVPEMLDVARARAEEGAAAGVKIDFQVADAQELPFDDASFDAVTVAYGIRNMPKRSQALSEALRVLKPGGSFTCLEFSTPPNRIWRAAYDFYLRHMIPFWGNLITGQRDGFVYLSRSIEAFPNQQDFAAMLQEVGFVDVKWQNCTGGIAAIHTARKSS